MPDWILTLLLAVVAPGGIITGLLLWQRENKKLPITKEDSQVAQALAISSAAAALFQTVTTRLAAQDSKVEAQDAKLDEQDLKYNALEETNKVYQRRLDNWHGWYANFVSMWPSHRLETNAPPPPE